MKAHFINNTNLAGLLDMGAGFWENTITKELQMSETPLSMQPTDAIRAQRKDKQHGLIDAVRLSAVHNKKFIAFRLEWNDPIEDREISDSDQFTDAVAIMLPSVANAPLLLMGAEKAPVNALYWRADEGKAGRNIVSTGFGRTRTVDRDNVACVDRWKDGMWTVIITRPLTMFTPEPVAQLKLGDSMPYGVAVWAGSNQERAGIKSFTLSKEDLRIDPAR